MKPTIQDVLLAVAIASVVIYGAIDFYHNAHKSVQPTPIAPDNPEKPYPKLYR